MPTRVVHEKKVIFRMSVDLLDKLDRYCEAYGYTRSEAIRKAIRSLVGIK